MLIQNSLRVESRLNPFIILMEIVPAPSIQKVAAFLSLMFGTLIIPSLAYILAKLRASILLSESFLKRCMKPLNLAASPWTSLPVRRLDVLLEILIMIIS